MGGFMNYIYSALWFIIAIYLFYQGIKQTKALFMLSAFFLYMSVWYLIDAILPGIDMFNGVYGIIFRCVAGVVLIVCIIAYIRYRKAITAIMNEQKDE